MKFRRVHLSEIPQSTPSPTEHVTPVPVRCIVTFSTIVPVVVASFVFKLFANVSFIYFLVAIAHNAIILSYFVVLLPKISFQSHNNNVEYVFNPIPIGMGQYPNFNFDTISITIRLVYYL